MRITYLTKVAVLRKGGAGGPAEPPQEGGAVRYAPVGHLARSGASALSLRGLTANSPMRPKRRRAIWERPPGEMI